MRWRFLVIIFLVLIIVLLSFIFVYLWQQNKKPIIQQPADKEFKVEGLIPFEQWKTNK